MWPFTLLRKRLVVMIEMKSGNQLQFDLRHSDNMEKSIHQCFGLIDKGWTSGKEGYAQFNGNYIRIQEICRYSYTTKGWF